MDPNAAAAMDIDEAAIDEGLYSRQLYVLGHEAMKRMSISNVLIVGLDGLGIEIAKNIALAGVKSLTIFDPSPVTIRDLGTQFFLRESDIGKPRAEATLSRLAELNAYVPVRLLPSVPGQEISPDLIKGFQVVVLSGVPLSKQLDINEWTHANGVHFIAAETRGLFGSVFNDFGPKFTVVDPTGEEPLTGMIVSVEKDEEGIVTCLDEARHGLEDGDFVTFREVQGMDELNGCKPRKVSVKGPYTFSIGDTTGFGEYKTGGIFTQVKMPKIIDFKPLKDSLASPEFFITDFAKFDRPAALHAGFQALSQYREQHERLPRPRNEEDAAELVSIAKCIDADIDEKIVQELSFQAAGELAPINAVIGGFVAQEALKAISAKFTPAVQHLYFDSLESLPDELPAEADTQPLNSRYDSQIAVFGKHFQDKISNHRQFLVGSGAIGCEMLKNWSMMGVGAGSNGVIHVTDLDTIEKSNLNRQFLFRAKDLGNFKSEVAAAAVSAMNPELKGHIFAKQEAVGSDTENVYNDKFFASIDGVTNALDNVTARQYMDRRCIIYEKPLLESGTLGTKGNTQVVLPYVTESYSSSQDPPEKQAPSCTVKSFPNAIAHTIEWARELFETLFVKPPQMVNSFLSEPDYVKNNLENSAEKGQRAEQILTSLVTKKPLAFDECIVWARELFEDKYNNAIQQLLFSLPRDSTTTTGQPFWSGPKRAPDPLIFDSSDSTHLSFIIAAANLRAFVYGLKGTTDENYYRKVADGVQVPEFTPRSGVTIQVNENDTAPESTATVDEDAPDIVAMLPSPSSLAGFRLNPVELEKDDDTNFHIDFITAASNLRATNYNIPTADRHTTKQIAGKIIPAIATTTSLVTGLVCLELYKIIDGKKNVESYKNGFVNLALPFFGFSEPIVAPRKNYTGGEFGEEEKWGLWDRIEFEKDITLNEFIKSFKDKRKLDIIMVCVGVKMLWSAYLKPDEMKKRLEMPFAKVMERVNGGTPVPGHVTFFIVEVMATATGEDGVEDDVDLPFIIVHRK